MILQLTPNSGLDFHIMFCENKFGMKVAEITIPKDFHSSGIIALKYSNKFPNLLPGDVC